LVAPVTCRLRLFLLSFILLLPMERVASAAPGKPAQKPQTPRAVAVIFARKSLEPRLVPWQDGLTISQAIEAGAPAKRGATWKEAWRYRESFWTRNFRDPHSFWARLFAGEKATGFTYFQNAPGSGQAAEVQPGDKLYVDLAPIP
jgi:hypothetical protein